MSEIGSNRSTLIEIEAFGRDEVTGKPVAKSFIDGKWLEGFGQRFEVRNPSTNEIIGFSSDCTKTQILQAFKAARLSQEEWYLKTTILEKEAVYKEVEKLLEVYRPQIVHLLTKEMGKVAVTADADVTEFLHCVQHYEGELSRIEGGVKETQMLDKMSSFLRKPFGVVLAITPWNFFAIPAWKIFGAITGGNACLLKMAEETPFMGAVAVFLVNKAIENALGQEKYRTLRGLVQIIQGRGETTGEAAVRCGRNRSYNQIAFTGGVETGRRLASLAGRYLIYSHMELGGHGTIIFFDDFPLEKGAGEIVLAAFGDAGQRCVTTKEVLVEETIFNQVLDRVIEKARQLRIGLPENPETKLGPLVSLSARERIHQMVLKTAARVKPVLGGYLLTRENHQLAKDQGLLLGEEFEEDPRLFDGGAFYPPTIFVNAPKDCLAMKKEIFGPVLCINKLPHMKDKFEMLYWAAKHIRSKEYGLSNAILTNNAALRYAAEKLIDTGILYRGRGTTGAELGQYFGGVGLSGWGREGRGVESFTQICQIYDDFHPEVRLAQVGPKERLGKMLKESEPFF